METPIGPPPYGVPVLDPFKVVAELARLTEAVRTLQDQTAQFQEDSDRKREKLHERIHVLSNSMQPVPARIEDIGERLTRVSGVIEQMTALIQGHTALLSEHNKVLNSHSDKIATFEMWMTDQEKERWKRKWFARGALFVVGLLGGVTGDKIVGWLQKLGNVIDPPIPPGH